MARVPKEFVVQHNSAANPPMLLLSLARLVRSRPHLFTETPYRQTLDRMFPRLQVRGKRIIYTYTGKMS